MNNFSWNNFFSLVYGNIEKIWRRIQATIEFKRLLETEICTTKTTNLYVQLNSDWLSLAKFPA